MSVSPGLFSIDGFAWPWIGIPSTAEVSTGITFGANNALTGTLDPGGGGVVPAPADVRLGTAVAATVGTLAVPPPGSVLLDVATDGRLGTYVPVSTANVRLGVGFGGGGVQTGTLIVPAVSNVLLGVGVDATTGTYVPVATGNVKTAITFGAGLASTGTYDGSDRWTDPGVSHVEAGEVYKANSTSNNRTGTLNVTGGGSTDPGVGNVRLGVEYAIGSDDLTGTLELPAAIDVRAGTAYGEGGTEFEGTLLTDVSPVVSTRLVIYSGDDYVSGERSVPSWTSGSWPNLSGAAVAFEAGGVSIACLVAGQAVSLDPLTAESTAALAEIPQPRNYRVVATLASGSVVTLVPHSPLSVR